MRLTDAQRATETAEELVELLAAYQRELAGWEGWTPAAAPLRLAIEEAAAEARELIGAAPPVIQTQARAH